MPQSDGEQAALFDEKLAEAQRAWPSVEVSRATFAAYVDERITDEVGIDQLALTDLYLACACAAGDNAAIAAFDRAFGADADAAFAYHHGRGVNARDLRQILRDRLFAPPSPKIAAYAGRGTLRSWLRITLLRLRIDAERRRAARPEDGALDAEAVAGDVKLDPELQHLKQVYRDAFARALETAIRNLSPRDRNLLRFKLKSDLGTAQIAAMYRVHRATAKRWLADVRQRLHAATREELARNLKATNSEVESVIRLIDSHFDVSVERMLGDEPEISDRGLADDATR